MTVHNGTDTVKSVSVGILASSVWASLTLTVIMLEAERRGVLPSHVWADLDVTRGDYSIRHDATMQAAVLAFEGGCHVYISELDHVHRMIDQLKDAARSMAAAGHGNPPDDEMSCDGSVGLRGGSR